MKQQLVADLLASERTLGEVVRDFTQAVKAQERADAEAKQRAADEAFAQACDELRADLSGYLPGIWETLVGDGEVEFIRTVGDPRWVTKVTFFVGSAHLKLARLAPGVIEVSALSGASRRLGFEADTQRNWLRFVELLADLTGEQPA